MIFEEESPVVDKNRSGEMEVAAFRCGRSMVDDEAAHLPSVGLYPPLQSACIRLGNKIRDAYVVVSVVVAFI